MILADENIDFAIIKALRDIGVEVHSIAESNSGISDSEVIKLSLNPSKIILTEDKDFGEWVYAHHVTGISVVFLRYDFKETREIIPILINLIQNRFDELKGCFTTITTKKIRIRKVPL